MVGREERPACAEVDRGPGHLCMQLATRSEGRRGQPGKAEVCEDDSDLRNRCRDRRDRNRVLSGVAPLEVSAAVVRVRRRCVVLVSSEAVMVLGVIVLRVVVGVQDRPRAKVASSAGMSINARTGCTTLKSTGRQPERSKRPSQTRFSIRRSLRSKVLGHTDTPEPERKPAFKASLLKRCAEIEGGPWIY